MSKKQFIEMQMEGSLAVSGKLLIHYKDLGINEAELILILQVQYFIQQGVHFPTPDELSERMTVSVSECNMLLRRLIQKGFLEIMEFDQQDILYEQYSLSPLWEKLYTFLSAPVSANAEKQDENLYPVFEKEFGRPLSPFESETLVIWMDQDHHDPLIIKAALREAVISGKLNFRYIDRILFEWKKNGIKTMEQALNYSKRFRQNQNRPKQDEQQTGEGYQRKIPFYNWLEK